MVLLLLIAFVGYAYAGYPLVLWILTRRRAERTIEPLGELPSVTVLLPARNEESCLSKTIESILQSDYPPELLKILVVSDASTDRTEEIAASFDPLRVSVLGLKKRHGKTMALAAASLQAQSDILMPIDASSIFRPDTVKKLIRHFSDPRVGSVGGVKVILKTDSNVSQGDGLYWKYDSMLRSLESRMGSSWVGCEGGIYAARKALLKFDFPSAVAIDYAVCSRICEQGYIHLYDRSAVIHETPSQDMTAEFQRKARIVARGIRAFIYFGALLNPFKRPGYFFQNVSHRLFRYLVPVFLPLILIMSATEGHIFHQFLFCAQLIFYSLGLVGLFVKKSGRKSKPIAIPAYFLVVNAAAFVAWFLIFKDFGLWNPTLRDRIPMKLKEGKI